MPLKALPPYLGTPGAGTLKIVVGFKTEEGVIEPPVWHSEEVEENLKIV